MILPTEKIAVFSVTGKTDSARKNRILIYLASSLIKSYFLDIWSYSATLEEEFAQRLDWLTFHSYCGASHEMVSRKVIPNLSRSNFKTDGLLRDTWCIENFQL